MNVTNVVRRRPRKSLLGTHRVSRESLLPVLPELLDSFEEKKPCVDPKPNVDLKSDIDLKSNVNFKPIVDLKPDGDLKSNVDFKPTVDIKPKFDSNTREPNLSSDKELRPLRKRLDSMFSPSSNDDSFIANETLIANESILANSLIVKDDGILATTLVDNSNITECNSETLSNVNEEVEGASHSVNHNFSEHDQEMLYNFLRLMDSMIEKNTQSVIAYNKQIEELQKIINNSNREIEDIKNMKLILVEKFKLKNVEEKENIVPANIFCDVTKPKTPLQTSPIVSPSKQIIEEMRSSIKFLKTPRVSRAPRSSVLLTPHSMSFCIKSQYEQLLE